MTNDRGEVSETRTAILHVGDLAAAELLEVAESAVLPGNAKEALYKDLVNRGGGEAQELKDSEVLSKRKEHEPTFEIEEDYRDELTSFYAEYGESNVGPLLAEGDHAALATKLFDGDVATPVRGLSHYMDALVQARFDGAQLVNRVDIHWSGRVPDGYMRLELQTSDDADAAWTSAVNDDRTWEFGNVLMGGTLVGARFPGETVTSLYFPERKAEAVRLLLGGFRDEVSEVRFYGPSQ